MYRASSLPQLFLQPIKAGDKAGDEAIVQVLLKSIVIAVSSLISISLQGEESVTEMQPRRRSTVQLVIFMRD